MSSSERKVGRVVPKPAVKGSQRWLQLLVNDRPDLLVRELSARLDLGQDDAIGWVSPLRDDVYAEYRDQGLLDRLGIALPHRLLGSFWPKRGPVWDGLGVSSRGDVLLVEAKSHIPELLSSTAAGKGSLAQIRASLDETRSYLGANERAEWTSPFYQYANRLAHLYLLRVLNNLSAYLVQIYFVGDREQRGPTTQAEWEGALTLLKAQLGLRRHKLSPYILDVFIDIAAL